MQTVEKFAIADAATLVRLVTCEVASLRGADNMLKLTFAELFLRYMHTEAAHCARLMHYLSIVEQRLNQSMVSILDDGFQVHLSGVGSELLFKQLANPNLEKVLAFRNGQGDSNEEAPQLLKVGDWKLNTAAYYMAARLETILTTLGAGKKWKALYDAWLKGPAGGELGWYDCVMAGVLAQTRDVVKMMKERFEVSASHRWVDVRSILAMDLCLLTRYLDCVD